VKYGPEEMLSESLLVYCKLPRQHLPEGVEENEKYVVPPELGIEPGTSNTRSRLSDRSSTTFGTNLLVFHVLYNIAFHIDTSCFG
jgi:hypothetical protein